MTYTFDIALVPTDRATDQILSELYHLAPADYYINEVIVEVSARLSKYYRATLTTPEEPRELDVDYVRAILIDIRRASDNSKVEFEGPIPDGVGDYVYDSIETNIIEEIIHLEREDRL